MMLLARQLNDVDGMLEKSKVGVGTSVLTATTIRSTDSVNHLGSVWKHS